MGELSTQGGLRGIPDASFHPRKPRPGCPDLNRAVKWGIVEICGA